MHSFTRRHARPLLGVLLPAALLLAGCGSSSSGLSHAEVVKRASADCDQAVAATAALGAPGGSYADLNHYAQQLSPIVKHLIGGLAALKPAQTTERKTLNEYLTSLRNGERALTLLQSADSADQASEAVSQLSAQPVAKLANSLGVSACASTPQP